MTLRYMLDTDIVTYAMRNIGNVAKKLKSHHPSSICISSLTLAQLRYGAKKAKSQKLMSDIAVIARAIQVAPFDTSAAERFGDVAAALAELGKPIGDFDSLIASHALTLKLIVVTNNEKHFSLVPGLKVENWT